MKTRIGVAVGLYVIALCATAQNVTNADSVSGQPVLDRDQNGFKSCGVRIVASTTGPESQFFAYDFSVNLWDSASGMMKAGQHIVPFDPKKGLNMKGMRVITPAPTAFWIAKRNDNLTLKPTKYIPSNDAGFTLGGAEGPIALKMILAIINGEPMQVSLQYPKMSHERIVAFKASMSDDDQQTINACLTGLVERMQRQGPPKPTP